MRPMIAALHRFGVLAVLACSLAGEARAQSSGATSARTVRGLVRSPDARPIEGANVFIIETLDGVVTREDGRFSIPVTTPGAVTLVVRRLGYAEQRRTVAESARSELVITLEPSSVSLAAVSIQAGQYTASEERGATLTPLQVVTTPGTAADVNRAIQSLPGVQAGDEGTALFVRGGDFTETRVFLNEAGLLTPVQLQSPSGTFTGTVDPFLLDGIFFSSGGFGARYGDALSGIAALRTLGRPAAREAGVSASLAALSARGGLPWKNGWGARATATRSHTGLLFDVNGTTREYTHDPEGSDLSGGVIWNYRRTGEIKAFGLDQRNRMGVVIDDPSFSG